MRRWLTVAASVVAVLMASPALVFAEDEKPKSGKDEEVFNFEADELTVSFLKPEIGFVGVLQQDEAASLIKIRTDFVDELVRSAEDL